MLVALFRKILKKIVCFQGKRRQIKMLVSKKTPVPRTEGYPSVRQRPRKLMTHRMSNSIINFLCCSVCSLVLFHFSLYFYWVVLHSTFKLMHTQLNQASFLHSKYNIWHLRETFWMDHASADAILFVWTTNFIKFRTQCNDLKDMTWLCTKNCQTFDTFCCFAQ